MMFISYKFYNGDNHGFGNCVLEEFTLQPDSKEDIDEVHSEVNYYLRENHGIEEPNAIVLWWKLL